MLKTNSLKNGTLDVLAEYIKYSNQGPLPFPRNAGTAVPGLTGRANITPANR